MNVEIDEVVAQDVTDEALELAVVGALPGQYSHYVTCNTATGLFIG